MEKKVKELFPKPSKISAKADDSGGASEKSIKNWGSTSACPEKGFISLERLIDLSDKHWKNIKEEKQEVNGKKLFHAERGFSTGGPKQNV